MVASPTELPRTNAMWLLQGLGAIELLLLSVVGLLLSFFRAGRRWLVGVMPCLMIAALLPPQDLLTMVLISIPMVGAFVAGVYLAPRIRSSQPY
jgi:Sec-independent protein secretion pathway component TatC